MKQWVRDDWTDPERLRELAERLEGGYYGPHTSTVAAQALRQAAGRIEGLENDLIERGERD